MIPCDCGADPTFQLAHVVIYEDDDFRMRTHIVQLAPGELMTFCHLDVNCFNVSICKRMERLWREVRPRLKGLLFAMGVNTDTKFDKFARHFGWRYIGDCGCTDGVFRRVYWQ
jgi:hypothetical protein